MIKEISKDKLKELILEQTKAPKLKPGESWTAPETQALIDRGLAKLPKVERIIRTSSSHIADALIKQIAEAYGVEIGVIESSAMNEIYNLIDSILNDNNVKAKLNRALIKIANKIKQYNKWQENPR